jgi:hypothetical protein
MREQQHLCPKFLMIQMERTTDQEEVIHQPKKKVGLWCLPDPVFENYSLETYLQSRVFFSVCRLQKYPQQTNSHFHLLLSVCLCVCVCMCVWVQLSIPGSAEFSKLQNFMSKQVPEEFLSTWRPFPFPPKPDPCCRSALRTFPCQNPNDPRSKRILREEEEE